MGSLYVFGVHSLPQDLLCVVFFFFPSILLFIIFRGHFLHLIDVAVFGGGFLHFVFVREDQDQLYYLMSSFYRFRDKRIGE